MIKKAAKITQILDATIANKLPMENRSQDNYIESFLPFMSPSWLNIRRPMAPPIYIKDSPESLKFLI